MTKKVQGLLRALGAPVQDVEEETFELFAQDLPSQNLGFINSSATTLDVNIAGRDLTIHQSPGVLSSNRAGGTTGAVVWKITPLFAEWLITTCNPLFTHGVLSPSSLVLELGSGISGLVGLSLASRIARYVLTDQPYVARLLEQNLNENAAAAFSSSSSSGGGSSAKTGTARSRAGGTSSASRTSPAPTGSQSGAGSGTHARRRGSPALSGSRERSRGGGRDGSGTGTTSQLKAKLQFTPLDWETDEVTPSLTGLSHAKSFDVVLACDCIYNEALVDPFVTTCVDLCRLRVADAEAAREGTDEGVGEAEVAEPTVCVIAQQLRDPLVFEAWLARFATSFHTWRVPDELLLPGLRANSGFVVHVGVLKGEVEVEGA